VGLRPLEDMGHRSVSQIARAVRQQAIDSAVIGIRVIDPVTLDHGPPAFAKLGGVVCRIQAGCYPTFSAVKGVAVLHCMF